MRHLSSCVLLSLFAFGCSPPAPPAGNDAAVIDAAVVADANVVDAGPPDAGHTCSYGGGCDLLGAACPDSMMTRQGCYPGMGSSMCVPAGSIGVGGACSHLNDCDDGLVCLAATSVCAHACCAPTDCALGEMCRPLSDETGAPLPNGVGFCFRPPSCTPLPNTGCAAMQQCVLVGTDGTTDCAPTGTAMEGMPCEGATQCVEGLGCYGTAGTFTCYRFCRQGMDADCTGTATTCTDAGLGDEYGLCM
jgi:hypothetical protein